MRAIPRILYLLCFAGSALVAALALDTAIRPSISDILIRSAVLATLCGAPGLIHRRLWPLGLVLLPVGAYLLIRTITPLPSEVTTVGGQFHFYVEQLRLGADAYVTQLFPLNSIDAPQLTLLLAFCVFWVAGAAAFLALSLRQPIPGIAVTLLLLGFSLTVTDASRAPWSAVLFVVLVACLLVLSRGIERERWKGRDIVAGGAVGVVASVLALLLLWAAPSAAAAPWRDWRAWDPFQRGSSSYTFNWLQQYADLLDPTKDMMVMKVRSSSPSYWRANVIDSFSGDVWAATHSFREALRRTENGATFLYELGDPMTPIPPGTLVTQEFQVQSVYSNYLFIGGDPRSISTSEDRVFRTNETRAVHTNRALGPSFSYTATAIVPDLKPTDLVGKGTDYPESLSLYLGLPFPRRDQLEGEDKEAAWESAVLDSLPKGEEWAGLYALSRKIVDEATDPYDVTLRIEKYLRRSFTYSLTPPPSDYSSPYAAFLLDTRSGYCQHFSGAMAALLRFNGIPARVAVGFASGELKDGVYTVTTNNAHAWVEVYFPEVGWVAFDPTPGRNLPTATSASNAGFINPFTEEGNAGSGTATTSRPQPNIPEDRPAGEPAGSATGRAWPAGAAWIPWILGLAAAFVAWPVGRGLWRRRRLTRGPLDRRLQASLALLRTEARDHGIAVPPSLTLEETMSVLEAELGISPDEALLARVDAILFGGRRATHRDIDQVEGLRGEVASRLRERSGLVRTGLICYGVPRRYSFPGRGAHRLQAADPRAETTP